MNIKKLIYFLLHFLCGISFISLASAHGAWVGNNQDRLNALINQYGKNSPSYNPAQKPVAAFDWDNTMSKNDCGEATLFWMTAHGKLKRQNNFGKMNPWLTVDALQELEKNCGGTSPFLPTRDKPACADTVLNIYNEKPLENGMPAWKPSPAPERIRPSYFFYAQLFAGYTPDELRLFTEKALQYNLKNKIGTTQKIGSKNYPGYVRIYTPMKNLVSKLQKNGFDVWIISASIQPTIEVIAKKAGIQKSHVIGVRQVLNSQGQLTNSFQGCGPYPDGNKDILSNRLGKRCWLNKIVFNIKDPKKMLEPAPIIFAAGDSAGDLIFLKDATGGRLVINKNNTELLCHAIQNSDGKWMINPMFIHPLPPKKQPYSCHAFNIPDQME